MPELPEVETIRRQLLPRVAGRRFTRVRVCHPRAVRAHTSTDDFIRLLCHTTVQDIIRRGKALLFLLDSGRALLVRLGMSGQLVLRTPDDPPAPHTHVFLTLDDGTELRYIDPRTFGQMAVVESHDPDRLIELAHYGLEPLDDSFTPEALRAALAGTHALIQVALMDQTRVAGIGKIYADEACFLAGINPRRTADSLTDAEVRRLHRAIRDVLCRAVEARGTSSQDAAYRDASGQTGAFQHQLHVYQRAGHPCRTCGTLIEYRPLQGRRMHFCPRCQR